VAERLFTPEEANELLDRVRPLVERAQRAQRILADPQKQRHIRSVTASNGGGETARELMASGEALSRVISELEAMDIVLRDPGSGLIDFPAERDGQPIYLCWRLGEDHVAWWHGRDIGFAGREPL
jgi:hypothetical protein